MLLRLTHLIHILDHSLLGLKSTLFWIQLTTYAHPTVKTNPTKHNIACFKYLCLWITKHLRRETSSAFSRRYNAIRLISSQFHVTRMHPSMSVILFDLLRNQALADYKCEIVISNSQVFCGSMPTLDAKKINGP